MFRSSSDHPQGVYSTQAYIKHRRIIINKHPEDDLNQIKTCCSLDGLYVKVYILILVHLLVLSINPSGGHHVVFKYNIKMK
jgi:predicted DNA binding CopG/RHH family protein